MSTEEEEPNELAILMKVLDIVKLRIEARELHNYEAVQISQIVNQFLPGTTIGDLIQSNSGEGHPGEVTLGDKYEASGNAQVAAMGRRVKIGTASFGGNHGEMNSADLANLVSELQSLRAEMRNRASTVDDDQAIVEIGQAISAAEQGDASSLLSHLKSAGKWALDLATAIGAELAAGTLRSVLGLPG